MNRTFLKTMTNIGVDDSMPVFLRKKIVNTNFVAVILSALCIPFIVFTYTLFDSLLIYPVLFFINGLAVIGANATGHINISRFLACVVNISLYTIYHCYLLPDGQPFIASLYAIQIVFWMIPWLLF